ncbi:MAG: hypothetical protein BWZ10_01671 [candidate division BRC1 bacterium ADurb.BinA364]|nr:MAG: hypothetical protein BWZ10_01671 [candidate division BRC1 bacterium ADurb.BinA364]
MALFQFLTWRGARGRSRFFEFALYWLSAASLPIIYYGLILDTGFAEIPLNHSLLRYHMEFHRYEPLTPATGARTYWQAFGLGLPLAALGLARAVRRGRWRDSDRLFACWLAASLWTLAMPFLFPRFLLYSLPPFAYFAALAAEWLAKKDWPFVDKRARGSQPLSAAGQ